MDIRKRWRTHINDLRRGKHHSKKLQRHYNKYGEDDLKFTTIYECGKEQLLPTEQCFLDFYHPYFNTVPIAGSSLGHHLTQETKDKIRKSQMGKVYRPAGWHHTEEEKENLRQKMLGRYVSEETRKKRSDSLKGRIVSDETKEKLRNKIVSDEAKEKIRQSLLKYYKENGTENCKKKRKSRNNKEKS